MKEKFMEIVSVMGILGVIIIVFKISCYHFISSNHFDSCYKEMIHNLI